MPGFLLLDLLLYCSTLVLFANLEWATYLSVLLPLSDTFTGVADLVGAAFLTVVFFTLVSAMTGRQVIAIPFL